MTEPIEKDGRLESPTFLGWARRQLCRMCLEEDRGMGRRVIALGSDPHHVELKGMGGANCRDDHVVPLCRVHHDQAHEIDPRSTILAAWAHETLRLFLDTCTQPELRCYLLDLERWRARPLACPF